MNKKLRLKENQVKLLREKLQKNKLTKGNVMLYLKQIFDKEQMVFFEMQLKNSGKKLNARRYSPEAKNFCLAIYKQSPKSYRKLRDFFT